MAVRRHDRRTAALTGVGDTWYEWLGEGVGLVVVVLVIAGLLPAWSLVPASLLLLRALSRLVMTAVRGGLDG